MRALVVFESMFGNSEKVAGAIGEGLATRMPVDIVEVGSAVSDVGPDVALLVVGGPTHAFGMSRPQTRMDAARQSEGAVVSRSDGIREWLETIARSGEVPAVAFDTRVMKGWIPGSAARAAQRRLRGLGFGSAGAPRTFYVGGTSGPLLEGELDRARRWGTELAAPIAIDGVGPQPGS